MGCLSPDWVGSISLVDFFCRHASLFPGLSAPGRRLVVRIIEMSWKVRL